MADSFPFGAGIGGPAEPDDPRRSRTRLLVLVGVGVALAVAAYYVVLPALSSEPAASSAPVTVLKKPAAKAKAPAKKPAAKKPAAVPAKTTQYSDAVARDPFKALWYKPQPKTEQPAVAASGATPVVVVVPAGGTSGSSSTTVGGQTVALIRIFAKDGRQYAETRVGQKVYIPAVGESFAGSFKLLAVGGGTASYLYGDEQFSLREGQEVVK